MNLGSSDISIFSCHQDKWEIKELKKAALKHEIKLNVVDFKKLKKLDEKIKSLGKLIIYTSSSLRVPLERTILLSSISDRLIINQAIFKTPFISHKYYQQKILENSSSLMGIKTYYFNQLADVKKAIANQELSYPVVVKKDLSSHGKDVHLIKKEKDLNIFKENLSNYIFQNFIENDGDYRVFIFGGKVIEMMKRKSADDKEFRNNVSLGGKPSPVKDKEIIQKLTALGLKTASLFNLQMCGVDVIFDQKEEEYRIMEINTAPNWRGLQSICKSNIGEEIIKHCKQLLGRETKSAIQLVKDHYHLNYSFLSYKQLHYASRSFLWFGKKIDYQRLKKLEEEVFNDQEIDQAFQSYFDQDEENNKSKYSLREKYLKKYPNLKIYCRILFKYLLAKNLFKKDISHLVAKYVSKAELKKLQTKLFNDSEAINGLSTPAINFIYLSGFYLGQKIKSIDYQYLLNINLQFKPQNSHEVRLKIYYLTHCIIGASLFYTRQLTSVEKKCYQKFTGEIEKTIRDNYFQVTLDNKFEFLVVAKLCDYQSSLKEIIKNEAKNSLSNFGNYLVDQLPKTKKTYGDNLLFSEHRNILYLMAMLPRKN